MDTSNFTQRIIVKCCNDAEVGYKECILEPKDPEYRWFLATPPWEMMHPCLNDPHAANRHDYIDGMFDEDGASVSNLRRGFPQKV